MSLPTTDTIVLYPGGAVTSTGVVLHREELPDGRAAILLDATAFHPVDAAWPDQPADRGTITVGRNGAGTGTDTGTDLSIVVEDAVVAATDGSSLFVGSDVPVKKGSDGWAFVVAHLVAGDAAVAEGDAVTVSVDTSYRHALSIGHTACHLASLALNRALAGAWRKEVSVDAAGTPNFDALAIDSSTIVPGGSVDVYRVGKSLRKKGFDPEALADPGAVERAVNATLDDWVAAGSAIRIDRRNDLLTGRREWVCDLPGHTVRIPCGGTHAASLIDIAGVETSLDVRPGDGAVLVTMTTTATADEAQVDDATAG
jgi:alanyl-tRNA synthetase